jgi:hypothetical protein
VLGAVADARGIERVDPHSAFSFAMSGRSAAHSLILSSASVPLQFSFGAVPLRRFEMRGTLTAQPSFLPGASLYAETVCATVPNYGAELTLTGICNPSGLLAASGTFTSSAYRGRASLRPPGLRVASLRLTRPGPGRSGSVVARLGGRLPRARQHVAAVLLTDARDGSPVAIDYRMQTHISINAGGRIDGVRLTLPASMRLPRRIRAYVIVDAFPLASRLL